MTTVVLMSRDGYTFHVSDKVAFQSKLIKSAFEYDTSGNEQDNVIPLLSVRGEILEHIVEWCILHQDDPCSTEEASVQNYAESTEVPPADVSLFKPLDPTVVMEIIQAANHMQIEKLVNNASTFIKNEYISVKSGKCIRETFGLSVTEESDGASEEKKAENDEEKKVAEKEKMFLQRQAKVKRNRQMLQEQFEEEHRALKQQLAGLPQPLEVDQSEQVSRCHHLNADEEMLISHGTTETDGLNEEQRLELLQRQIENDQSGLSNVINEMKMIRSQSRHIEKGPVAPSTGPRNLSNIDERLRTEPPESDNVSHKTAQLGTAKKTNLMQGITEVDTFYDPTPRFAGRRTERESADQMQIRKKKEPVPLQKLEVQTNDFSQSQQDPIITLERLQRELDSVLRAVRGPAEEPTKLQQGPTDMEELFDDVVVELPRRRIDAQSVPASQQFNVIDNIQLDQGPTDTEQFFNDEIVELPYRQFETQSEQQFGVDGNMQRFEVDGRVQFEVDETVQFDQQLTERERLQQAELSYVDEPMLLERRPIVRRELHAEEILQSPRRRIGSESKVQQPELPSVLEQVGLRRRKTESDLVRKFELEEPMQVNQPPTEREELLFEMEERIEAERESQLERLGVSELLQKRENTWIDCELEQSGPSRQRMRRKLSERLPRMDPSDVPETLRCQQNEWVEAQLQRLGPVSQITRQPTERQPQPPLQRLPQVQQSQGQEEEEEDEPLDENNVVEWISSHLKNLRY